MGLFNEALGFLEGHHGGQQQQQGQGGYGGPPPPPPVYPPWRAEWDARDGRYIFVNEQTGERSWQLPGGYQQASYNDNSGSQGGYQQAQEHHGPGMGMGVLGGLAAAGAGILGYNEFEKHKDGIEQDFDRAENNVEDFPENAARWTGDKVGEVEGIPDDIENAADRFGNRVEQGWDNAVADVEDAPEDAARWAGDKVGDVERFGDDVDRFGDNVQNSYDEGRDEGRYGDDDNNY